MPVPPRFVEAVYSSAIFAVLQPLLTSTSNVVPIAMLDVLLLLVAAALAISIARDFLRRGWRAAIGPVALRLVVWASAAYVAFLVCWGFNYRRIRLIDRLAYSAAAVNDAAATTLLATTVDRLNALHRSAHGAGWPATATIDPALAGAFDRMARELGTAHRVVIGRPKRTVLDWYFRRAGVDGMTDPYFLETLVNTDLLPFERPFVIAHEWSHLAGLADEGEANFGAWLTCLRGSSADQYSGWLSLFGELSGAVPARNRAAVVGRLAPGPRDDLRAIRARVATNVVPQLSAAGWRVYDSYLKANRVEAGAASYGEVVKLILGARLPDGSRAY